MKLHVGKQADALYPRLDDSRIVKSQEVSPDVVLDVNELNQVEGIEMLDLSERYARRVETSEIEENESNLNISRYVSTAEPEEQIDLREVHDDLVAADNRICQARADHDRYSNQLGLSPLP